MEPVGTLSPSKERLGHWLPSCLLLAFFLVGVFLPTLFCAGNFLVNFRFESLSLIFFQLLGRSVFVSAWQALWSALLACGLGISLGLCFALSRKKITARLASLSRSLGYFAFHLPTVTISLLVLQISFHSKIIPERGLLPIVVAHVLMNVCFIAASTETRARRFLAGEGLAIFESAALMGARGITLYRHAFRKVFVDEWKSYFSLIFMWSFSAFSTVLILGGGPEYSTPEVLLFYSLKNDFDSSRIFIIMTVQFFCGALLNYQIMKRGARLDTVIKDAGDAPSSLLLEKTPRDIFAWSLCLLCVWPFVGLLRSVVIAAWESNVNPELLAAAGNSLLIALLAIGGSIFFFFMLIASCSRTRQFLSLCMGLSSSFLMASWLILRLDFWTLDSLAVQVLMCVVALLLLKLPLFAFWIERRIQSLGGESFESAQLMGCRGLALTREIVWPATRDLLGRIVVLSGLSALGEIAVMEFFLRDAQTLALLSQRMAYRYDFSGASSILLFMTLLTLALIGIERKLRWRKRFI